MIYIYVCVVMLDPFSNSLLIHFRYLFVYLTVCLSACILFMYLYLHELNSCSGNTQPSGRQQLRPMNDVWCRGITYIATE